MKHIACTFAVLLLTISWGLAKETARTEQRDISYYSEAALAEADEYQKSQCKLDVSSPTDAKDLPVVVWFHGGGLSAGKKEIPKLLRNEPLVLVGVGYRLTPQAKFPDFLNDAAAAVAWTFANVEKFGGDPKKIFVGGNSAGGYLTGMVGLDPRWLKSYDIDRSRIAGLMLLTGQVSTHFHVREILKYPQGKYAPLVDENSPLFHLAKTAPPILLTVGDRKIEWPGRVEENAWMAACLKAMKHPHVEFYEHPGFDHGQMGGCAEAFAEMRRFIDTVCGK